MWLGSCVALAVVQAGICISDLTPSLGTGVALKSKKKKKKKKLEQSSQQWEHNV